MRRREFITLLGGAAAAWPIAAWAQQPAMPVGGFMSSRLSRAVAHLVAAFRDGLKVIGFVEGQNVAIDFHWARSLADFAKLVELFDRHGVSFVSVTQQFNTTTSMGRLTSSSIPPPRWGG
jgi:hypothetical protein